MGSACFLNDNNNIFIVTSNNINKSYVNSKSIKILDLNGKTIKEINDSINHSTFFIDTYYDNNSSKTFIITGNEGYSQSYDYNNNKLYYKYIDNYSETNFHMSIIIVDRKKIIKWLLLQYFLFLSGNIDPHS